MQQHLKASLSRVRALFGPISATSALRSGSPTSLLLLQQTDCASLFLESLRRRITPSHAQIQLLYECCTLSNPLIALMWCTEPHKASPTVTLLLQEPSLVLWHVEIPDAPAPSPRNGSAPAHSRTTTRTDELTSCHIVYFPPSSTAPALAVRLRDRRRTRDSLPSVRRN